MYEGIIQKNQLFKQSRLRSLYSDFDSLKEYNPDGYEANLLAWKKLFKEILDSQQGVVLDTSHLIDNLSISTTLNDGVSVVLRPLSIDTVINEIVNDPTEKSLLPLKEFQQETNSIYNNSLLGNISLKSSVFWLLSRSGIYDSSFNVTGNKDKVGNYLINTQFVYLPKMESLKNNILKLLNDKNNKSKENPELLTKSQFEELLEKKLGLSNLDCAIMLKFLTRDTKDLLIKTGSVITKNNELIEIPDPIIKIKSINNEEITANDVAVVQLKGSINSVNSRIDSLDFKIKDYQSKIQKLIGDKTSNRDYIKLLLKTKKSIESSLINATANLANLEGLLSNIQLQTGNIEVVQLLNNSKNILKDLNNELTIEKVDILKDDIHDEINKVNEINDTLAEFNDMNNNVLDEKEIDKELEEMERQQVEEVEHKQLKEVEHKQENSEQNLIDRLERLKVNKSTTQLSEPVKEKEKEPMLSA